MHFSGPCQTPTLTFCVERHQIIQQFTPEPFWVVKPQAIKSGRRLSLDWARGKVFDPEVAVCLQRLVAEGGPLKVTQVSEKEERRQRPHGLNTVELLKLASTELGMGPAHAMSVAERLYTQVN
jgi:DNA topoisomerase III